MLEISSKGDSVEMNSDKMNKSIFRQFSIGIWWGAFRNLLQQANFYLLLITCISSVTTLAFTVINPWLADNFGIHIPLFVVLIVAVGSLLLVLLFEHKLTMPSYFEYWNRQWYEHGNLLKERLDVRDKEIDLQHKQVCDKTDSIEAELKKLRMALLKKNKRKR